MTTDDMHFQARMAMAEQIGEARACISIAIIWLKNSQIVDNSTVQDVLELLHDAEANLRDLRRVPKRTPEEVAAAAEEAVRSLHKLEQQEKAQ